jgi:hypothetical protein
VSSVGYVLLAVLQQCLKHCNIHIISVSKRAVMDSNVSPCDEHTPAEDSEIFAGG